MKEVKPVRVGERLAAGKSMRKENAVRRAAKRGASDEKMAKKTSNAKKASDDQKSLIARNDARTAKKQGRSDARADAKSKGKGSKPMIKGRKDNSITSANKKVTKKKREAVKVMKDFS